MAELTFRILSGSDRGRVIACQTPVTIGRESGNTLQLNDLLVSRCHLKIQEDNGVVLLADCESTNGTRVNGEPVRQWILRPGDLVTLGGTTFLVGTRAQIEARLAVDTGNGAERSPQGTDERFFAEFLASQSRYREIFQSQIPSLPDTFTPLQTAQVGELLQYIYLKVRTFREWALREQIVQKASDPCGAEPVAEGTRICTPSEQQRLLAEFHRDGGGSVFSAAVAPAAAGSPSDPDQGRIPPQQWQNILDMESLLATYLRKLEQPDET